MPSWGYGRYHSGIGACSWGGRDTLSLMFLLCWELFTPGYQAVMPNDLNFFSGIHELCMFSCPVLGNSSLCITSSNEFFGLCHSVLQCSPSLHHLRRCLWSIFISDHTLRNSQPKHVIKCTCRTPFTDWPVAKPSLHQKLTTCTLIHRSHGHFYQ